MLRIMRVTRLELENNRAAAHLHTVAEDGKQNFEGYLVLNNLPLDHAYAIGQDYELSVTRARKEVPSVA